MSDIDESLFSLAMWLAESEEAEKRVPTSEELGDRLSNLSEQDIEEVIRNAISSEKYRAALVEAVATRQLQRSAVASIRKTNLRIYGRTYIDIGSTDQEILRIVESSSSSLVTLVGASGTGKTRSAQWVGQELLSKFEGGVWFIDLKTSPEISQAILRQISDDPGIWLHGNVADQIGDKNMLLILDDISSSNSNIAMLSELLSTCANLKIVATTKKSLGVSGENVFDLSQRKRTGMSLDEAVQFLGRMVIRALDAPSVSFGINDPLRLICKKLIGVPLAMSLVAGCLASSTPESILSSVQSVTTGRAQLIEDRQIPPTIRALIDLSVKTMNSSDAGALKGLSLFTTSFTEAEASQILGDTANVPLLLEQFERLGMLESTSVEGVRRFHLLDSVIEYLAGQSAIEKYEKPYVSYFSSVARETALLFEFGDWSRGISSLLDHLNDFRKAVQLGRRYSMSDELHQICRGLVRPIFESGLIDDFENLCGTVEGVDALRNNAELQVQFLGLQGANASRNSNQQRCEEIWLQRLELCRQIGDDFAEADTLTDLAYLAYEESEIAKAFTLLDQAETIIQRFNWPELLATVNIVRARCCQFEGDTEGARKWLDRVEESLPNCENKELMLFVYQNIAICYEAFGDASQGRTQIIKLLAEASSGSRTVLTGWSLGALSRLYEDQSDYDSALKCLVGAQLVFQRYASRYLHRTNERLAAFLSRHPEFASRAEELAANSWQGLVAEVLAFENTK